MAVSISLMPVITTGSVAARWPRRNGGRAGRGRVDGPALQASFNTPSGIAADAQGNLYVADTGNHAIRRIGTDGQVTTLAGGEQGHVDGPAAQARFDAPMGIAVDAGPGLRGRYLMTASGDRYRWQRAHTGRWRSAGPTMARAPLRRYAGGTGLRRAGRVAGNRPVQQRGAPRRCRWHGQHRGGWWWRDQWAAVVGHHPRWRAVRGRHGWPHRAGDAAGPSDRAGRQRSTATPGPPQWPGDGRRRQRAGGRRDGLSPAPPAPATGGNCPHGAGRPSADARCPIPAVGRWRSRAGTKSSARSAKCAATSRASRHHLHGGFDVRGDVGQTVLAIADGKISSPMAAWSLGEQAEGLAVDRLSHPHAGGPHPTQ